MNAAERRMEIFRLLQENQSVEVVELAARFNVTTMTIRRDLAVFEKQGLITTNYGGAYLNKGMSIEPSFSIKSTQRIDKKQMIGYEAAKMIRDGDVIIIDCGTTTLQLAKYLKGKKLTVITNSWPVVSFLGGQPKIKLLLAPGEYDDISAGTFGISTAKFIGNFHADRVFIGTHGCSPEQGASVPEMYDAEMKRVLLAAGKEKILMVDHSKFGVKCLAKHAELSEFDYIITDNGVDPKMQEVIGQNCQKLIVAQGMQ